jgi:hypothetical protein
MMQLITRVPAPIRVKLLLRIMSFAAALWASSAMAGVDAPSCSQVSEAAAARLRWALAHRNSADAARTEDSCFIYRDQFYEAAVTRQTAFFCEDSGVRQQALSVLDAEIDAFNDLIAVHCGNL